MKCNTRDFGEITFSDDDIIHFVQPPFGFDEYTDYILIFDDADHTFAWMQSIVDTNLCFVLINTNCLVPTYTPLLPPHALSQLGDGEPLTWAICVIPDDITMATANLKSPILINPHTCRGMQVVLTDDYPIRHLLATRED